MNSSKADWAGGHWVRFGDSTPEEVDEIWDNLANWRPIAGLAWNPAGKRYLISGVQNPYEVTEKAFQK